MKTLFASIWFCLLLLPSVGSGQGIEINEKGDEGRELNYDYEDRYAQSKKYTLKNAAVYTKQRVRKVELFDFSGRRKACFMVCFDKEGRIISRLNIAKSGGYTIKTDSFFEQSRITIVDSFFERESLERVDSLVIDKIGIRKKNNKEISYDRTLFKSYKSGYYLNKRNEYYRSLIHEAKPTAKEYLDHGRYTPQKRIDGNFYRYRHYHLLPEKPFLSKKSYESRRFYLAQTWRSYNNIIGAQKRKETTLLEKNQTRLFVRGEDFVEKGQHAFSKPKYMSTCGFHRQTDRYTLPTINKESKDINANGLTENIYKISYYEQDYDKPCVKPKDSEFTDYLRGYSGVPVKSIQYYYRYEYFDE